MTVFEVDKAVIINGAHVIRIDLSTAIWHRTKTVDLTSTTVVLMPYVSDSFLCPQAIDLSACNE